MEFVDGGEHFCDVEAGVFLFEDARVGEEGAEVAAWDVFHGEVDVFCVLEGVEETDEPWGLCGGEDVAFDEDVSDLLDR
jgi:hypothetical protein